MKDLKPVVYLDVDDTILRFPPMSAKRAQQYIDGPEKFYGLPAPGVEQFLTWLRENAEVRWLTAWAPWGAMHEEREAELAQLLKVDPSLIADWHNPLPWYEGPFNNKLNGINWDEHAAGRRWIWIEDGILHDEREGLKERGAFNRWLECNTSHNAAALQKVWRRLQTRKDWAGWWET